MNDMLELMQRTRICICGGFVNILVGFEISDKWMRCFMEEELFG